MKTNNLTDHQKKIISDLSDNPNSFFIEIEMGLGKEETAKNFNEDYRRLMEKERKAEKKLKNDFKKKLRGLINVTGLYKWLDENDGWSPLDIVEIKLTDEKSSGYASYQHARIVNDQGKYLYMKTDCDEIRGIDHYYVWQTVGFCGDDYSGYLLFPLKNGKYFKANYSC